MSQAHFPSIIIPSCLAMTCPSCFCFVLSAILSGLSYCLLTSSLTQEFETKRPADVETHPEQRNIFAGMSLHRRLASSSPQSKHSGGGSTTSSGYAFDNLRGGLGFPGVFDNIWSSTAVGGWTLVKEQSPALGLDSGLPSEHFNFDA